MDYTVVFDGECSVCHRFAAVLRRWDREKALEIVPSQGSGVKERFPWITPEDFTASIQLVAPDGSTLSGAAALEELLRILPRGTWFAWVFRVPFARPIVERSYRFFAGHRHRMGCRAESSSGISAPSDGS